MVLNWREVARVSNRRVIMYWFIINQLIIKAVAKVNSLPDEFY